MSVQAETPASEPAEKRSPLQYLAGWLRWPLLFWAAIGALNAFADLLPSLRRFSLIIQALTSAYRVTRDWLYARIYEAFSWVQITLPEIPEFWQDILIIASLALLALNFESFRRDKVSLPWALLRAMWAWISSGFGEDNDRPSFLSHPDDMVQNIASALAIAGLGVVFSWLIFWFGVEPLFGRFENLPVWVRLLIQAGLIAAAFGIVLAVVSFYFDNNSQTPLWLDRVVAVGSVITLLPAALLYYQLIALWNGKYAVLAAIGLLVALIGLDWVCVHYVDPLVAAPPAWLTSLIAAGELPSD